MMVAGIILYCLIKRRLVRCCEKENPAHLLEQGGDRGIAKMAKMPRWPPAHGPCSPAASAHSGLQPVRHREHVGSHASAVRCHGHWPTNCPASESNWSSRRPRGPPELPASTSTGGVRNPPLEQPSHPIGTQRNLISHSKLSTVIVDNPNYTFTKK